MKNKIISFFIIFFSAFFLVSYLSAQDKNTPDKLVKKKSSIKNYIWIEGEDAVATNFSQEKTYNFFCSGRHALQLSKEAAPTSDKGYYAVYVFYVPKTRDYDFWLAGTPPGSNLAERPGYSSPFDWKIDEGEFTQASAENVQVNSFYAPGGYYWNKISTGKLSEGKHTLTIRINQKRSSGWDYFSYIDAMLFLPKFTENISNKIKFPGPVPKSFNIKGKGLNFKTKKYYMSRVKNLNRSDVFDLLQVYGWLYENNKAIDLANRYLQKNPRDIQIRILLASNLAWADRLDESIKEYKNIIKIDSKNITARKLLAVLAGWNNRYDEAIRNYKEIISIDPQNVDAYISLATQLSWNGEVNQAIEVFRRAEKIAPDNIDVLYALGDNYYWNGKTYEAISKFKDIISIDEKEISAYKKLANIYLDLGSDDKAESIIKDAERIRTLYPELASFSLDIKGEQNKKLLETINEYKTVLRNNPENIEARKNLIDTYRWNKMEKEAITEYSNMLNVKLYKKIDREEDKLISLQVETTKFQLLGPVLKNLKNEIQGFKNDYSDQAERLKEGKELSENYNKNKVLTDYSELQAIKEKVDLFEKNLSMFNDVISIFDKEIQNFYVQKNALKWKFDNDEALDQAKISLKDDPGDYRIKKIIGLIDYLSSKYGSANKNFSFVYEKKREKVLPVYILSLSSDNQFKEAEGIILNVVKQGADNRPLVSKLDDLLRFKDKIEEKKLGINLTTVKSSDDLVKEMDKDLVKYENKLSELLAEMDKKIKFSQSVIKQMYEKSFLELQIDNVPINKEIGQFYLNNNNMYDSKQYFTRILMVQPLNVDINFTMGAMNESLGYWQSALKNYEICINNQPTNNLARNNHFELQKEYSPSIQNDFVLFSDAYDGKEIVKRMTNSILGTYPYNDLFSFKLGYTYMKIEDNGGATTGGQEYYPSVGSVTRQTGNVGTVINVIPIKSKLHLNFMGHMYSGSVDYNNAALDSDISYSSINYEALLQFTPFFKGLNMKLGYAYEDEAELSQSTKQEFRDAITSQKYNLTMDVTFNEFNFPLNDRVFLYDSVEYRSLSDNNTRLSIYNELTFRLLRFIDYGINFDLAATYSQESSDFTEYDSGAVTNLPYWAPEDITSYSGGLKYSHDIANAFGGDFGYSLAGKYTYESVTYQGESFAQKGYSYVVELHQDWDKVNAYASYNYSTSTADATSSSSDPKPYTSSEIKFGVKGKFFSRYTASGKGARSLALASVYPDIITADGDGKDDYADISLTAFDERGIAAWRVDFIDSKNKKVNSIGQSGTPPSKIKWDGTDKAGNLLPQGEYFCQFSIDNSAKKTFMSPKQRIYLSRKKSAVTLSSNYNFFSPNNDGIKDKVSVGISSTDKSEVNNWTLFIKRNNSTLKTITGKEFLPFDISWDGKDSRDRVQPDGPYNITLQVKYKNGRIVASPSVTVNIKTRLSIKISSDKQSLLPKRESIKIRPLTSEKEVDTWKLMFSSENGTLLKMFQGSGQLPENIEWNGVDEKNSSVGFNIPVIVQMELTDKAGNKSLSNESEIWIKFYKKNAGGKQTIYVFDQGYMHGRKKIAISKLGDKIIQRLANEIKSSGGASRNIKVIAYTSSDGSEDANKKLTEDRARKFADQLQSILRNSRISSEGKGEAEPFRKNDSDKWDDRYEIEIN